VDAPVGLWLAVLPQSDFLSQFHHHPGNFDEFWIYDFNLQLHEPVDRVCIEKLADRFPAEAADARAGRQMPFLCPAV
jgi:hypothetical protein